MIPSRYRWEWKQPDERQAQEWAVKLGIPPLVARVLAARGWTEEEAAAFFRPADGQDLADPYRMKGMAEAVERICKAIVDGERIRVYGDYDADGVTSTALMIRLFTALGASFDTYIPHRGQEGYGLNPKAVELAKEAGVALIVTVDNGISAVEQIAYARELGMDVVVTDHHEPPVVLPEASALVNPKQPGCPYPFKGLCGAGVAFRLAHALLGRLPLELADLAAIGTVADLMPLIGENRTIVRMGLDRMRDSPSAGIRALAAVCGIQPGELTSGRIGFAMAPRLNAGGRLDRADGAVKLLTTEDPLEAQRLARELDKQNAERQRLVDVTVEEAESLWEEQKAAFGGDGPRVIVLSREGWNPGIAGLVASKLVERHYRPAVILAEDAAAGLCKGSARSIDGFDLYAALTACAELMEHFGGHQAAAGLTIRSERVGMLADKLHQLAGERLRPEDWIPKKQADLICKLEEATLEAADALSRLEPFGQGHPVPRLMLEGVRVQESRTLGKDGKHLRLTVVQDGCKLEAVGFGMGSQADRLTAGRRIDLLGELDVNEWNGTRRVQFKIQDLRSEELHFIDRRQARDPVWHELAKLAAAYGERLVVLCGTAQLAAEAAERLGPGVPVATYAGDESIEAAESGMETAAAASHPHQAHSASARLRVLALLGLPNTERDIALLHRRLAEAPGWEAVFLLSSPHAEKVVPTPDRNDFARVYALMREQSAWTDGPEGFLRSAADRCGLPLASVRLIQEVFEELGFIRARGAERSLIPNPPKRNLEQSERYVRMRKKAEVESFPDWPLDKLKEWAAQNRRSSGNAAL